MNRMALWPVIIEVDNTQRQPGSLWLAKVTIIAANMERRCQQRRRKKLNVIDANKHKSQCTAEASNSKINERKQTNTFSAVFVSGNLNNQDWYVDSGASVHLTPNKQWLTNISYEKEDHTIIG